MSLSVADIYTRDGTIKALYERACKDHFVLVSIMSSFCAFTAV